MINSLRKFLHKNCNKRKTKVFSEPLELMSSDLKHCLGLITEVTIDDDIDSVFLSIKGKNINIKNKSIGIFLEDKKERPDIPNANIAVKDGI